MFGLYNRYKVCVGMLLLTTTAAQAEIILHGTRAIYPSDAREITLQISNNGRKPALVQAWIDEGNAHATPDQSTAPFMITPPITRVEAQQGQYLRITSLPTSTSLSQDQETLFWLNILDIPPKPSTNDNSGSDNFLQFAVHSRIKFFYRPSSIKENRNTAAEKIQWQRDGSQLLIKNPTPFYITMTSIYQKSADKTIDLLPEGLMLKPFSEHALSLKHPNTHDMTFITINDYGGRIEHTVN